MYFLRTKNLSNLKITFFFLQVEADKKNKLGVYIGTYLSQLFFGLIINMKNFSCKIVYVVLDILTN